MYHRFIYVEVNCLQKCSSVAAGQRTWPGVCMCVCSCVCICWGTGGLQTGRASSWPAGDVQAHFSCQTPAAPPCGHLFRCLGPYPPGPIILRKLPCTLCCAESQGRCKPLWPHLLFSTKAGSKPPHTIPSIGPERCSNILSDVGKCTHPNLPLVLRRK